MFFFLGTQCSSVIRLASDWVVSGDQDKSALREEFEKRSPGCSEISSVRIAMDKWGNQKPDDVLKVGY
jgi:hypothetical protein